MKALGILPIWHNWHLLGVREISIVTILIKTWTTYFYKTFSVHFDELIGDIFQVTKKYTYEWQFHSKNLFFTVKHWTTRWNIIRTIKRFRGTAQMTSLHRLFYLRLVASYIPAAIPPKPSNTLYFSSFLSPQLCA